MAEPETKIKIKMGIIEIEYEGPAEFFRKELHDFIISISKADNRLGVNAPDTKLMVRDQKNPDTNSSALGTVRTVAARLTVQSGTDLILATAAFMSLAQAKDKFTRKELLAEMQNATGYYKTSYSSNLSKYLKTLVGDGKLAETAAEVYALTPAASTELKAKLA